MHRINLKPLSVNECFRGRRFKTKEYDRFIANVALLAPKIKLPPPPYQIHFVFGFSSLASDWDNAIKCVQDSLAKKYGFNDKLIRKGIVEISMVKKGQEYFDFEITSFLVPGKNAV